MAKKKKEREMADVAHEFLLKRRTWLVWNERLRGRERDAWVLRREEGVMGGVLDGELSWFWLGRAFEEES